MRRFIWYSPEIDVIVIQTILEGCESNFEWGISDIIRIAQQDSDADVGNYLWVPIGEL